MIEEQPKNINKVTDASIENETETSERSEDVEKETDISGKEDAALIKEVDRLYNDGQNIPAELLEEPVARERYLTILRENLENVMAFPQHYHKMDAIISEITRVDKIAEAKRDSKSIAIVRAAEKEEQRKKLIDARNELDSNVEELRNNGLNNKEIAEQLDRKPHIITQSVRRLLTAGRIEPQQKGRPKNDINEFEDKQKQLKDQESTTVEEAENLTTEKPIIKQPEQIVSKTKEKKEPEKRRNKEIIELDNQVEEMRNDGLKNTEIAERLGKKYYVIAQSAHRLITEGRIESKRKLMSNVRDEVDRKVEEMRNNGLNNEEIATELGIKKSTVRYSVKRLLAENRIKPINVLTDEDKKELDDQVDQLRTQGLDVKQIAEKLKRSKNSIKHSVHRLAIEGRIESRRKHTKEAMLELDNVVEQLRNQGLGNSDIAELLLEDKSVIGRSAMRLIAADRIKRWERPISKEIAELDNQVEQLRKQKLGNTEIAKRLDKKYNIVAHSAQRLIAAGRIEPWKSPTKATKELDNRVEGMRNSGLNNKEIAKELKLSQTTITRSIRRLLSAGRIEPRKRPVNKEREQLDNQVEQLRNQGLENDQIAKQLDKKKWIIEKSAQRLLAANRIERLRRRPKEEIVALDNQVEQFRKQGLGNKEIAEMLEENINAIEMSAHRLIKAGRIESQRIRKAKRKQDVLDSQVEKLRNQGLYSSDIARELDEDIAVINRSAVRLIKGGKIERQKKPLSDETKKLYEDVERLRKQDLNNDQVAESLGVEMKTVRWVVHKLITDGRIEPRKINKTIEEREQLDSQVEQLRNQGLGNTKIAASLKEKKSTIANSVRRLVEAGRIEPYRRSKK
jgi:predicted transcriptional regulator